MLAGDRTFVGFGFGPIQAGLFLAEAFASGGFKRLVVVEVVPELVTAVQRAGGLFCVNVAHDNEVAPAAVGPIDIYDPASTVDQGSIVDAVAIADEVATALPSVAYYSSDGPSSAHRLLAQGLHEKVRCGGPPAVVYVAENHNHAAEILEGLVMEEIPVPDRAAVGERVRFVNTVIGKMSRVVADQRELREYGLEPLAPGIARAVLVESFNEILISKITFGPSFVRGISAFEEKEDLLPFEEAKLYGHNAAHALAGYLGALVGVREMADLSKLQSLVAFVRRAFIEEAGEALVRKHRGIDPLFTREGFRAYADDLLQRMLNPFLHDTIERVTRDTERKLGWDDRLIGTMRVALANGVQPRRFALGAAAAVAKLQPSLLSEELSIGPVLHQLWEGTQPGDETIIASIERALDALKLWCRDGYIGPDGP